MAKTARKGRKDKKENYGLYDEENCEKIRSKEIGAESGTKQKKEKFSQSMALI